jgi:hypothetical protein
VFLPSSQIKATHCQPNDSTVLEFPPSSEAMNQYQLPFAVALISFSAPMQAMTVLAPSEDIMTSPFFQGTDLVRGYSGDNRGTLRVSTDNPFGVGNAETIYMSFGFDPANYTGPVARAVLSVTSVSGGFNADASAATPFLVSAHAVNADPFSSITDDTNATGSIAWNAFLNNNILAAVDSTSIDDVGVFQFDVTPLINDWIAGTNTQFSIALTGKNDIGGNEFLHGFSNNTEVPGATFLTINPVPEPSTALLSILGITLGLGNRCRKARL